MEYTILGVYCEVLYAIVGSLLLAMLFMLQYTLPFVMPRQVCAWDGGIIPGGWEVLSHGTLARDLLWGYPREWQLAVWVKHDVLQANGVSYWRIMGFHLITSLRHLSLFPVASTVIVCEGIKVLTFWGLRFPVWFWSHFGIDSWYLEGNENYPLKFLWPGYVCVCVCV
jgi:hypothetical protein